MAESHVLINLYGDLKKKINLLASKNAVMDAWGHKQMNEIMESCANIDRYIDSYTYKEEHSIPIGLTYEHAQFNLTAIPRGNVGPTNTMRRYAAQEEKKVIDRVDRTIQMGRELEANKDKPYFSINY